MASEATAEQQRQRSDGSVDIATAGRAAVKYGATPAGTLGAFVIAYQIWGAPVNEDIRQISLSQTVQEARLTQIEARLETMNERASWDQDRGEVYSRISRNQTDIEKIIDKLDLIYEAVRDGG